MASRLIKSYYCGYHFLRQPRSSTIGPRNSPRGTNKERAIFAHDRFHTRGKFLDKEQRLPLRPPGQRDPFSLVIRTHGFSPPQRSAYGCSANGRPFDRPSRRAPWIYTDTPRTRVCTRSHCQTMAILPADSRTQPLGCRLTFSARDDGVGLGHGSMVGVNRKLRENGTGNGTVRPTISVDIDFF